jgi:hypothetical protein
MRLRVSVQWGPGFRSNDLKDARGKSLSGISANWQEGRLAAGRIPTKGSMAAELIQNPKKWEGRGT